jgi:hypothetical protein
MCPQRHAERTETRACVCDVSLSLAPYRRFLRPLKTNSGRAASSLFSRSSNLRNTQERGRGGTRVRGMRVAETRAGVRDVSLSLAPYRRFVSPLKTNTGREASWLKPR